MAGAVCDALVLSVGVYGHAQSTMAAIVTMRMAKYIVRHPQTSNPMAFQAANVINEVNVHLRMRIPSERLLQSVEGDTSLARSDTWVDVSLQNHDGAGDFHGVPFANSLDCSCRVL